MIDTAEIFVAEAMLDGQMFNIDSDMSAGMHVQHPETEFRLKKVSEKFIESIHLMVNEPSVGLFRIHEHVRRSVPQIVDKKLEMQNFQKKIHGVCYDLDYSIRTVQSMQKIPHFTIIQECLRSAIASKQNLDAAKNQRTMKYDSHRIDEEPVVIGPPQAEVEGSICPNCMKIWNSQDELIIHWQNEHATQETPINTEVAVPAEQDNNIS
ncbi:BLOC-1-related complex subunit 8 homolog isoform X2 [Actinia tenebrosa]|uniref:BLOC-1-related complex subunit 8 homolog isoform X2 n=1 Tax=Actinia tenebrosa TaxID=6105 RepID=A0A6P8J4L5_ACTTE|nr:BLOC-1-related complex subunit 8 homolog isoform X2 [Actinia tenebrosa]